MKPALNLARQCPRFPSCSVNRCPLDSGYPNQFVDRQDKEKRCRMEKGVRLRIAATAPGTLRLGGLTLLEVAAKKRKSRGPRSSSSHALRAGDVGGHQVGRELDPLELDVEDAGQECWTISVLARPGTPTSRQWPRVKIAANICSITSDWPMMIFCNSSCIKRRCWLNSCRRRRRGFGASRWTFFGGAGGWGRRSRSIANDPGASFPLLSLNGIILAVPRKCGSGGGRGGRR